MPVIKYRLTELCDYAVIGFAKHCLPYQSAYQTTPLNDRHHNHKRNAFAGRAIMLGKHWLG